MAFLAVQPVVYGIIKVLEGLPNLLRVFREGFTIKTLKFAPHEERPSTSLIILKPTWHSSLFLCIRNDRSEKRN